MKMAPKHLHEDVAPRPAPSRQPAALHGCGEDQERLRVGDSARGVSGGEEGTRPSPLALQGRSPVFRHPSRLPAIFKYAEPRSSLLDRGWGAALSQMSLMPVKGRAPGAPGRRAEKPHLLLLLAPSWFSGPAERRPHRWPVVVRGRQMGHTDAIGRTEPLPRASTHRMSRAPVMGRAP